MSRRVGRNLYETVCRQNANKLPSRIFVHKSSPLSTLPLMIPEYIWIVLRRNSIAKFGRWIGLNIFYFITHWKWIGQGNNATMLYPTCNTYARTFTFTQSTTREEMKIVITYTLTHWLTHALTHSLTHARTHSRTHSLTHSRLIVYTQSLTGIITFLSLSVALDLCEVPRHFWLPWLIALSVPTGRVT